MSESIPRTIGIIGAGVMGEALISALLAAGIDSNAITISEKRESRAAELVGKYGIKVAELAKNVAGSDALLLVVKPQDMIEVLSQIKEHLRPETLVISFAAGKKISFISSHLAPTTPIVRVMPNTPTLVGEGMAAISVGEHVSQAQSGFVQHFLSATGRVVEVKEELQDSVTALSGSGPAYFFYFVEAMISAGTAMGLPENVATELAIQTIVGSAKLLATSGKSPATLRENVTSPNGTTAAALSSFADSDLSAIVEKAMRAASRRSQELA